MKKIVILLGVLSLLTACGDRFYTASNKEDLWRLPLIKPYEFINLYNADSSKDVFRAWSLEFHYRKSKDFPDHVNVTNFNVEKGIIYGHGKGEAIDMNPDYRFIVIPGEEREMIFETEGEWRAALKKYNIVPVDLLKPWATFYKFKDTKKLPWRKEEQ